jgi:hypothetical protein
MPRFASRPHFHSLLPHTLIFPLDASLYPLRYLFRYIIYLISVSPATSGAFVCFFTFSLA